MKNVAPRRTVLFLGSALTLALTFAGVYLFFVTTRAGQILDQRAFLGARLGQRTVAPVTLSLLDALLIAGVVVALVITIAVTVVRHNWVVLTVAVSAAVLANVLTQLLKYIFLDRPNLDVPGYAFNSLPSGHTTLAASSAMVVFLVSSPRMRVVVAAAGALFSVLVGSATLANQWHRPSDVIAALLIVAFCGALAGVVLSWFRSGPPVRAGRVWRHALWWCAVPSTVFAVVVLTMSALRQVPTASTWPVAYLGGVAGITASALLLAAAAHRAFRSVP